MNGVINVYKEKGFTSFDVVAKLRGILKMKKIGHTGTLDPDATGVLPVCTGNATKLCDMLTEKKKQYRAVMKLGIVTDTLDITGTVLKTEKVTVKRDEVIETIKEFIGEIKQIPPMYSAIKINGKKLYELARAGIEVERKARTVTIEDIVIENITENENGIVDEVTMLISCSKGTYIRSLCSDIGERLLCGACMKELERTKSGDFLLETAYTLAQIEEYVEEGRTDEILIPVDEVLRSYAKETVSGEGLIHLLNGNKLVKAEFTDSPYEGIIRVYGPDGRFYAVYEWSADENLFRPVKMFL